MSTVTLREIAAALNMHKTSVLRRAEKEAWPYQEVPIRGGYQRRYDLDHLPQEVRDAIDHANLRVQVEKAGRDLAVYADDRKLRLSPNQLADPETWKKVHVLRVLAESASYSRASQGRVARAEELAKHYGVSLATIWRWEKEADGWKVSTSAPRIEIAGDFIELPKTRKFDEAAVRWGLAKYGQNIRRGKKWAYGQLEAEAAVQGWTIAGYEQFTKIVNQIPDLVWDACRRGTVAVRRDWEPKVLREWLKAPVYWALCGDQNVDDCEAVDPSTGEIIIMNDYLWMDCASRAVPGLWPSFGPYSKYTLAYSLRMACGLALPDSLYTDWGGPETSHHTAALVEGLNNFCTTGSWADFEERFRDFVDPDYEEDGIEHRLAQPGIPWHKPIENVMNQYRRDRLNAEVPGFRQRSVEPWENKAIQTEVKRQRKAGELWTIERQLQYRLEFIQRHNAKLMKLKEGPKIVPGQILASGLASQPERTRIDDRTLDLLFLPRAERTPMQSTVSVKMPDGVRRYAAMELSKLKRGQRVTVHADPFDPDRPAIISIEGDFYCLAELWKGINPVSRDGLSEQIRYQRSLLKQWRQEIEKLIGLPVGDRGLVRIGKATKLARTANEAERDRRELKGDRQRAEDKLIQLASRRK
jgi:predicted DNA-binding transcriptional regulator AlpA